MFDGMTTIADSVPFISGALLRAGDTFVPRDLPTLSGGNVRVPDPRKLVHLQMRRCPPYFMTVLGTWKMAVALIVVASWATRPLARRLQSQPAAARVAARAEVA